MNPTFDQIYADVIRVHPCSPRTTRSDLKLLGIHPLGLRQRPQRYPADAAAQILRARGHTEEMIHGTPANGRKRTQRTQRKAKR